ncbi:hypothetical protein EG850_12745 [Gulosibacter macacae]|uniref:HIRAN domain-containing protein n=1 Tax=Gulosibacter macacae TaxID=2488791 RepID=A0A3P3VY53_9MICO|nr:hypothetical protein EG850_12745 [Gulosibacter macacae]
MLADSRVTRRRKKLDDLQVVDLSGLDTIRQKVKGVSFYLSVNERKHAVANSFMLVRDPRNEYDSNAVGVYSPEGRQVGHVSASRAVILAPEFDRIGADAYRVSGAPPNTEGSVVPFIDLPTAPAIRAFAAAWIAGDASGVAD